MLDDDFPIIALNNYNSSIKAIQVNSFDKIKNRKVLVALRALIALINLNDPTLFQSNTAEMILYLSRRNLYKCRNLIKYPYHAANETGHQKSTYQYQQIVKEEVDSLIDDGNLDIQQLTRLKDRSFNPAQKSTTPNPKWSEIDHLHQQIQQIDQYQCLNEYDYEFINMDYKVNKLKEEEQAYDLKQQHNYNPLLNNKVQEIHPVVADQLQQDGSNSSSSLLYVQQKRQNMKLSYIIATILLKYQYIMDSAINFKQTYSLEPHILSKSSPFIASNFHNNIINTTTTNRYKSRYNEIEGGCYTDDISLRIFCLALQCIPHIWPCIDENDDDEDFFLSSDKFKKKRQKKKKKKKKKIYYHIVC